MASPEPTVKDEMRDGVAVLGSKPTGTQIADSSPPDSPARRAQSAGPAASHIQSKFEADHSQRRSSSRGSTGIPFAMPGSTRRVIRDSVYRSEPLQFGGAMASVYGASGHQRMAANGPLGRSQSGSPGPGRSSSPAVRRVSHTTSTPVVGSPLSPGFQPPLSPSFKGVSSAPGGGVRLATDDDGDESAAGDSSNNDSENSDLDDAWTAEQKRQRGRQRTRKESRATDTMGREIITANTLLAAARAEHRDVSASYKFRSLLEPGASMIGPNGERMVRRNSSGIVHPHTSFDQGGSGHSTPLHSDHEDSLAEIRSAQQLSLNISPIQSSPEAHRCVRQVVRGDYSQFADDAQKGLRRQRVYLVSTDLSDEAAYALEWTIGTVLRDGDTLLAVYAVDEEVGVATGDASGTPVSHGTTGRQESDHLKRTLSNHGDMSITKTGTSALSNSIMATEADVSAMGKAEKERYKACVEVSDRCVKLLRRTRLQVRAVVEVFHCKSPKHMITEVIDFLEPTLVILGSRGRNALKGVLLGSFSNYLVTKSSVPVMVARKRLRKHSKYKRQNMRMSNVLANPSDRLANAKVD